MKSKFSTNWIKSVQPRKQRKFRYNAPLHLKRKFLSVHLVKELRLKYNKRNIIVHKNDKVKILRGQFKGKSGNVERVDIKKSKVFITGIEGVKKDGTKTLYPITPSNIMITELNLDDKKRILSLEKNKNGKS